MMNKYLECVCIIHDKDPHHPTISFRQSDYLWDDDGFCGGGPGYSHFGITMKKRETKAHAVDRLISKQIDRINEEISKLERDKFAYISLLEQWTENNT